jgi:hypothetical protein
MNSWGLSFSVWQPLSGTQSYQAWMQGFGNGPSQPCAALALALVFLMVYAILFGAQAQHAFITGDAVLHGCMVSKLLSGRLGWVQVYGRKAPLILAASVSFSSRCRCLEGRTCPDSLPALRASFLSWPWQLPPYSFSERLTSVTKTNLVK